MNKPEIGGIAEYQHNIFKGIPVVPIIEGQIKDLAKRYGIHEEIEINYMLDYTRTQDEKISEYLDYGIGNGVYTSKKGGKWVINVSVAAALKHIMDGFTLQEGLFRVLLLRELQVIIYRDDLIRYWELKLNKEKSQSKLEKEMTQLMLIKAECRRIRRVYEMQLLMGMPEKESIDNIKLYIKEIYTAKRDTKGNLREREQEPTRKPKEQQEIETMQEYIKEKQKGKINSSMLMNYLMYNKEKRYPYNVVGIETLIKAAELNLRESYLNYLYEYDIRGITKKGYTGYIESKAKEWNTQGMEMEIQKI